jgi:hypothetical protein
VDNRVVAGDDGKDTGDGLVDGRIRAMRPGRIERYLPIARFRRVMTEDDASNCCRKKAVKSVLDLDEAEEGIHGGKAEHRDTRVDEYHNSRSRHRRDDSDYRTWDNPKHNPKSLWDH